MTAPDYRPFDFREIAALDDSANSFRNWLSKSSSFFSDYWGEVSGYGAQLKLAKLSTDSYGNVLKNISREAYCCQAEIAEVTSSLWYASIEDLRILVAELLCLPDAEGLIGKELSHVETSLIEFVLENLAISLTEGWLGVDPVSISLTSLDKDPSKTRVFRDKDLISNSTVQIELKSGTVNLNWLIPKQHFSELLDSTTEQRDHPDPVGPSEQLVGQLPIELVTILGNARIPMSELSKIDVGQLIVLDQRIDQPVVTQVNNADFFECWPGRLGKNQALEITNCIH